ncbi:hypothetical protein CR205_02765 [Alteribacter lacisalsi]|uniref:Uncharacterized protein n=1 Tax=Alteribacter lacisalsi TaxID=2045244 RepID=A0A2W0HJ51_9BACI|nr:hypothetical protein [Alteribacter lacisalsi]PYZ97535.1 hypothetical protein CR205_02765 [Alteribacter lacisalsi]
MKRRYLKKRAFRQAVLDEEGNVSPESIKELQKKLNNAENDDNIRLSAAESKVLAGVWIQFAGSALEAIGVTEELHELEQEEDDPRALALERQAVTGVWLQTIGTALAAFGFSLEVSPDREQEIQGRKLGIIGAWFEAYGAAMEALAETALLRADLDEQIPF